MSINLNANSGPVPTVFSKRPRGPSGNQDEKIDLTSLVDPVIFHQAYESPLGNTESDLLARIKGAEKPQQVAILLGVLRKLNSILAAKESGEYLDHKSRLVQISAAKNVLTYKIHENTEETELFFLQNKGLKKLEDISTVARKNKLDDKTLSRLALAVFDLYPLYKDSLSFGARFETMKELALDKLNEALKKPDIKLDNKLRILKALMVPGIVIESQARQNILIDFVEGLYQLELGNSDKALKREVTSRVNVEGPLQKEFQEVLRASFRHRKDIQ